MEDFSGGKKHSYWLGLVQGTFWTALLSSLLMRGTLTWKSHWEMALAPLGDHCDFFYTYNLSSFCAHSSSEPSLSYVLFILWILTYFMNTLDFLDASWKKPILKFSQDSQAFSSLIILIICCMISRFLPNYTSWFFSSNAKIFACVIMLPP